MTQQLISSYSNSGRATFAAFGTSTGGICGGALMSRAGLGTSTCCGLSGGEEGSPSRMASRSAVGLDKTAPPCLFGSMAIEPCGIALLIEQCAGVSPPPSNKIQA